VSSLIIGISSYFEQKPANLENWRVEPSSRADPVTFVRFFAYLWQSLSTETQKKPPKFHYFNDLAGGSDGARTRGLQRDRAIFKGVRGYFLRFCTTNGKLIRCLLPQKRIQSVSNSAYDFFFSFSTQPPTLPDILL
jgi:hypothetical protein